MERCEKEATYDRKEPCPPQKPMPRLAALVLGMGLVRNQVSGLTVVDDDGVCAETTGFRGADLVTSPPQALLSTVARQMIDAHIHRVIVVDDHGHPLGIVSSTDIVAAVAYAAPDQ